MRTVSSCSFFIVPLGKPLFYLLLILHVRSFDSWLHGGQTRYFWDTKTINRNFDNRYKNTSKR